MRSPLGSAAVRICVVLALAGVLPACSKPGSPGIARSEPGSLPLASTVAPVGTGPVMPATNGTLTLHFYDVGQGLAVLVDLPDGRHVMVDAGDMAQREGCGDTCARTQAHLLQRLRADLHGAPLDMLWLTHPHADHVGGAPAVLATVPVRLVVDNGRDERKGEVKRAREAAVAAGARLAVVDPDHRDAPLPSSAAVTLRPVLPDAWPRSCREDANECSIGLRIDFGRSSVLLTGDAEHEEEKRLDVGGPVTLLQVGHHGSDTSTSPALLARLRPRYAVVSAGKPGEGLNQEYCHPRALVIERLTQVLGGPAPGAGLTAFDGTRCDRATPGDWVTVPTSAALWATERDGDVVLTTSGDGVFTRAR
jgi:competence protein ComEC